MNATTSKLLTGILACSIVISALFSGCSNKGAGVVSNEKSSRAAFSLEAWEQSHEDRACGRRLRGAMKTPRPLAMCW